MSAHWPGTSPAPAPEPTAPGKKKLAPRAKPSKAAPDKDKAAKAVKEAPGPKVTRTKKAKAKAE